MISHRIFLIPKELKNPNPIAGAHRPVKLRDHLSLSLHISSFRSSYCCRSSSVSLDQPPQPSRFSANDPSPRRRQLSISLPLAAVPIPASAIQRLVLSLGLRFHSVRSPSGVPVPFHGRQLPPRRPVVRRRLRPYRSQEGLSTRPAGGSDEVQLRIDPMHGELDDEITGLRKQVRQLRNVAQDIETEAKFQNDLLNQLQMTLIKAQAGVKNNVRRLNKSIVQYGSSNVVHVVAFALVCFFFVYLWSKLSRR